MKYKNANEYLSEIKKREDNIKNDIEHLEMLKETSKSVQSSFDFKKDVVKSSNKRDFSDLLSKIADFENDISKEIDDFFSFKIECMDRINKIEYFLGQKVLIERFIKFKTLNMIAGEMNYSSSFIRSVSMKALHKFKEKNPELFIDKNYNSKNKKN